MGLKEVSHVELGSFWLRAKLLGRLSARLWIVVRWLRLDAVWYGFSTQRMRSAHQAGFSWFYVCISLNCIKAPLKKIH
jgi:hypothetical protein